jgi:hypothetical protein
VPLLICRTCPRDKPDAGAFGPLLDDALTATGSDHAVRRHVACVGGCLTPGNVALDSLGKARVRFSGSTNATPTHCCKPPAHTKHRAPGTRTSGLCPLRSPRASPPCH